MSVQRHIKRSNWQLKGGSIQPSLDNAPFIRACKGLSSTIMRLRGQSWFKFVHARLQSLSSNIRKHMVATLLLAIAKCGP
jgi:hypothetical protein